jgi:hypothetical protein
MIRTIIVGVVQIVIASVALTEIYKNGGVESSYRKVKSWTKEKLSGKMI